ncbi:hypothetical protein M432DRAFT_588341 [Thermoascus aurantiacus ATCC 26904]
MEAISGGGERQQAYATFQDLSRSSQPVVNARGKETLTAHSFLNTVEKTLELVQQFFSIQSLARETRDNGENATLHAQHTVTDVAISCMFPDLDITKNPQWWVMNPGYRMEGKLPTFAEKENLPLRALRSGVTIGRKELLIEFELSEPGIALVLIPVVKKLQHLPYPELKLACDLLRRGMYPNILRVSRLFSDDVPKYQLEFNIVLVWPDQPYGQFFAF